MISSYGFGNAFSAAVNMRFNVFASQHEMLNIKIDIIEQLTYLVFLLTDFHASIDDSIARRCRASAEDSVILFVSTRKPGSECKLTDKQKDQWDCVCY